ncbi:MAG: sigma-70 family RNA polymerase sigma factor [Nakamurella sp.]
MISAEQHTVSTGKAYPAAGPVTPTTSMDLAATTLPITELADGGVVLSPGVPEQTGSAVSPTDTNPTVAGPTEASPTQPSPTTVTRTDAVDAVAAAAPTEASTLRRRQDVGDLVVRAGTAFEEYRQGVPGAIDTLVRLVSPLLWHTARQCGLTSAEAEDVVQQTFLSLVRSKDSVSDPLAVVRWLTVSLRRLAWRERSNSAKRSNEEPTDEDLPRAPSAEHTAVLTDQQRRLWEVVGELNERCRRLLAVIAFAPRPDYAAIAVDLGIPVGSIGPTRGRCLAKLRARLDGGDWT